MNTFPSGIKFKYPWRNYQARVLAELENFLDDNTLHVVAPPGSGKTVLGLEVMLRINKPTLILAPTIAVRNQWIDRFCELFLQTEITPEWISYDIKSPSFLTVSTYQGVHAACNDFKDNCRSDGCMKEIVRLLREQGVQTVVVDEAHHLKNEWWTTLISLKEKLKPTLVGLTATPPYDVSANEWQRYIELNGPIDTEITVPELIIEGDLCPHQDCVCFSRPSVEEYKVINKYRNQVYALFQEIKQDEELIRAMTSLSVWTEPNKNLDWIYSNMPYYSSLLIFLNTAGLSVSSEHLDVLGDKHPDFPVFDYQWAQVLLEFYLLKERGRFTGFEKHQEKLEHRLLRHGVMEHRQITFLQNKEITSLLGTSIEKLNSIYQIVNFEYRQLGQGLRLVVLTDFIRKEFLVNAGENTLELNKLGVIPIFEKLRRTNSEHMKIGVLTGSIIILPVSACELFEACAESRGVTKLTYNPLPYDTGYIQVALTEGLKNDVVKIVTDVFQKGGIEILIGTKSLLGEGWDSPCINSLILASFVGSFMLSNQMRGRAIRVMKEHPEKTSNIWHLVCLRPWDEVLKADDNQISEDYSMLERRMEHFLGLHYTENTIENGIKRLSIIKTPFNKTNIDRINRQMLKMSGQRDMLKKRWDSALAIYDKMDIVDETEVKDKFVTSVVFWDAILTMILSAILFLIGAIGAGVVAGASRNGHLAGICYFFIVVGLTGIMIRFPKIFMLWSPLKRLKAFGNGIRKALEEQQLLEETHCKVVAESPGPDNHIIYLSGGSGRDKALFAQCVNEFFDVIDNQRYILVKKKGRKGLNGFYAIPNCFSKKKEDAECFAKCMHPYIGGYDCVYTRNEKGRELLLEGRVKALANREERCISHKKVKGALE